VIRSPVLQSLAAVVVAVGCTSNTGGSSSTTTTTTTVAARVTSAPATRPSAAPTTKAPVAKSATHPLCTVGQLTLDYYGKITLHGTDFALVRIRNVATQRCTLTGPILITGIDSSGGTDTSTLTYLITNPIVLSPNALRVAVTGGPPPGEVVADLSLAADPRRDPSSSNGLCNRHGVTPSSWRLTFPSGTRTVANTAPTPTPGTSGSTSLATCHGQLSPSTPVTPEHA
jgi:hypothetical protein